MKAIQYKQYGPPSVIELVELEKPTPKESEVRIEVRAASVTPADCAFRTATPSIIRLFNGFFKPKNTPGFEFAGRIEAVGSKVTKFRIDDLVFGLSAKEAGTHAEYLCLDESEVIAHQPVNHTAAQAVGICDGALTALVFLRDVAQLQTGQKLLVNGAGGAVGSYAIQLAKQIGAEVTAVCSASKREFAASLGADHVIDYQQTDFTRGPETYDVIFDAVGKSNFGQCKGNLKADGVYLSTQLSCGVLWDMLRTSFFSRKKARFAATGLRQTQANLNQLKQFAENKQIKSYIDRVFPIAEMQAAHTYVEAGHKQGNVVVQIQEGV